MLLPQLGLAAEGRKIHPYVPALQQGVKTLVLVQPWKGGAADLAQNMPNIPSAYDSGVKSDLAGPWGDVATFAMDGDSLRYGPYPKVEVFEGTHPDGGEGLTIEFWYNFINIPTHTLPANPFSSWNTDDPTIQMPLYAPWGPHIGYTSWRAASLNIGITTHNVTDPVEDTNSVLAGNAPIADTTGEWFHYAAFYGPDPTTPTTYRSGSFNNGVRTVSNSLLNAEASYNMTNHVDLPGGQPVYFVMGDWGGNDLLRIGEFRVSRGYRYDIDSGVYVPPTGPFVLD